MGKAITQEDLDGSNKEEEKQSYYKELVREYGELEPTNQIIFQRYFDHLEKFIPSELQPNKIVYKAFFNNPIDGHFAPLIYQSTNSAIKAIYSGILNLKKII